MEAFGTLLEVWKLIREQISSRIGYVNNLDKNFEELHKKFRRLDHRKEDVSQKITGKRSSSECEGWLKEVDEIQNKRQKIQEEYNKNETWLGGWCPNLSWRLNLSKQIAALTHQAEELQKFDFKGDLMIREPQHIMPMPAPRVLEGDTTADQTLQELLAKIKESNITRIGLWGMGGIGKTTIMKILHNHLEIKQMFDSVLWITVSKEGTNRSVQEELARMFIVQRQSGESNDSLRRKVFSSLKSDKFLLLLDDVWDMIDLEEVGVPLFDEGKTGSKVVLSTRFLRVCNKMGTDEQIEVKALSENEAWSLFQERVGVVANDPRIEPLAREVAKECCGLPLAIVVVAGALRNVQGIYRWKCALWELKSSVSASEIEDMEEKVFKRLKYSYDWLKDESTKKCFLYCALFPEDWMIPKIKLVEYWINEGFIDGCSDFDYAHDKGLSKMDELLEACLLEKVVNFSEEDCVKMHDVMRDLALRISSTKGKDNYSWSFVKAGVKLLETPILKDWEKTERISLMENGLTTLPQTPPNCPMLTTLFLQGNSMLKEIALDFFVHMPALLVLDLSKTHIYSLPQSISNLANLQGLYLNNCEFLKVIPSEVRGLSKLEIFQMEGKNEVCHLPPEIEDLASLKHFEVCCSASLNTNQAQEVKKMFPRISKLSKLERLGIHLNKAYKWWGEYYSEGVMDDISMLNKLTHLFIEVSKIDHLECFIQQSISWKQLTTFRLHIYYEDSLPKLIFNGWNRLALDDGRPDFVLSDQSRRVMLYNDRMWNAISDEILACLDTLAIGDSVIVQSLSEFGWGKMKELKYCYVICCKDIETIVQNTSDLLPNLKSLDLISLHNLKSMWEGPVLEVRRCFPSLTYLYLEDCPKLKRVLSKGLISQLSNLEYLNVNNCCEVEEIISIEVREEGGEEMVSDIQTLLPQLKTLCLFQLPQLRCICSNKKLSAASDWPSLEVIIIYDCYNLKSLPHGFSKAPNIESVECNANWWEALEWEDDALKQQLYSKVIKR